MLLLQRFDAVAKELASEVLSTLLEAYSRTFNPDIGVSRHTLARYGAHLILTPRIP